MPEKTVKLETKQGEASLPAGTRLSDDTYQLDKMIAAGGMGEVYRGRLVETGDTVAIKMIKPEFAGDEAILALFRKEASALHSMSHDAIVRYFMFSVDRRLRRPYLAMEFVDGVSLKDRLRQGPLTFDEINTLRRRVASGLQAAHDKDIIHRDMSPDNIILPNRDIAMAKIIDFGIARTKDLRHTTVIGSGFAGKLGYVSPEQLGMFGGDVTNRSDIYSLGLVLAEAARGSPLDMAGNDAEVVEKRHKVPDLAGIDRRLRPLLKRMLQPDPKDRFASMAQVAAWEPSSLTAVIAAARTSWRPVSVVILLLVAVAGAAYGGYGLYKRNAEESGPAAAEARRKEAEATTRRAAEEAEARRKAEAAAAAERAADEAEARRKAEAAATAKRAADEAEARRKVEAEAAAKRAADEAEARRKAEAAATAKRAADEAEARRKAEAAATAKRAADEAEARRKMEADAAAKRAADEAEARRKMEADVAAKRAADEAEARRKMEADVAAKRAADEAEARRKMEADAAAKRAADEAEARRTVEAEAAARRAADEAEARRTVEAEAAARRAADEAEARQKVEAEASAKRTAEEARRMAEAAEVALRLAPVDRQRLQVALTSLGFDTHGIDGAFGARSRQMILEWQRSRLQPETGFLTASQQQQLLQEARTAVARYDDEVRRADEERKRGEAAAKRSVPAAAPPAPRVDGTGGVVCQDAAGRRISFASATSCPYGLTRAP